jgi:hypothetical protein
MGAPRPESAPPAERVWLAEDEVGGLFQAHPDWCGDGQYAHLADYRCTEYVRADSVAALLAETERLRAALREIIQIRDLLWDPACTGAEKMSRRAVEALRPASGDT